VSYIGSLCLLTFHEGRDRQVRNEGNRMQIIVKSEPKIDQPLRVLIVEDVKSDVALLLLALRDGGFEVTYEAVATQAAMRTALQHRQWDHIRPRYAAIQRPSRPGLGSRIKT
jgi:PleD family two-component response regulator